MDNTIFPLTALHIEGQIDGWIDRYCDDISRKKPLPALDICYQQVLRMYWEGIVDNCDIVL
ncbi:hypothetical protein T4C_2039 [Trichinella pseudospiralis]|uniref:Uncharacterized protein n=1 Tax=Trichinella pseudospiralis TaxID=6337 RepID=A0A0V1K1Q9_TRIPS|nr:hypothetical protein T4C_2039 [Trichinella pseudospiralis]